MLHIIYWCHTHFLVTSPLTLPHPQSYGKTRYISDAKSTGLWKDKLHLSSCCCHRTSYRRTSYISPPVATGQITSVLLLPHPPDNRRTSYINIHLIYLKLAMVQETLQIDLQRITSHSTTIYILFEV